MVLTKLCLYIHLNGTMPQAGIDQPAQSHASYMHALFPQATTGIVIIGPKLTFYDPDV